MNEETTKLRLITPIILSRWPVDQVEMEYPIKKNESFGGKAQFADYLLLSEHGMNLAVVEAKADIRPASDGITQAKAYAAELGTPFYFATNGNELIEFCDLSEEEEWKSIDEFPSYEELWEEYLMLIEANIF